MRMILLCVVFFFFSFSGYAQFNDSLTHLVSFGASGNINRTSTSAAYLLTNEARFSTKKKRFTTNSSARWLYGEIDNKLSNNDFITTHDFNRFNQKGNFYYWGLANYITSYSLRINDQLQAGLGVAYNFVNTSTAWFNLSNGLLYETSSITLSDSLRENYQTFRNSFRLSYRFVFGNIVTVSGSNYLQNSLENNDDYIIRATNSVGLRLNKWLSFTTTLIYNQVRRTERENLLFTYGLTAEKYF